MLSPIRPATPEEIAALAPDADLTPLARIVAYENNFAVLKPTLEVDPVKFDPASPKHKRVLFLWGLEQIMRFQGQSEYYFNVSVDNKEFIEDLEKLGAVNTSLTPEYRYKKVL